LRSTIEISQPAICPLKNVPVVQRIEQGFPKGKMALLLDLSAVVSSAQIAAIKPVD
jgi:hypothetical protein